MRLQYIIIQDDTRSGGNITTYFVVVSPLKWWPKFYDKKFKEKKAYYDKK